MNSTEFLDSGIKCDTYEPDPPIEFNYLFNSFITALKQLCGPFPIFIVEMSANFHSFCAFLIWSRIFNLEYLTLIFGCMWYQYFMSSRVIIIIDSSALLANISADYYSSADDSKLTFESKISFKSEIGSFGSFSNKLPSSNYAKVLIFPVCL